MIGKRNNVTKIYNKLLIDINYIPIDNTTKNTTVQ